MVEDYKKPALTFSEQLDHLKHRGLVIDNEDEALRQLSSISYYRLSGYWYPFRERDTQGLISSRFINGSRFDWAIELYEFDRKLRSLILDAIERVEVAVRTQLAYHMGHKYGAFGHTDAGNFHAKFDHARWLAKLEEETRRSSDEFIRHYKDKYNGFPHIPVWMLIEVMSFGALSFFYKGLRNDHKAGIEDKKAVAQHFGLHHKRLGDWLHTFTYVRNVCAHHSRLWNRKLAIRPDKAKLSEWSPPITPRNDRVFYVLLMFRHLLRHIGNDQDWVDEATVLIESISGIPAYRMAMGVPDGWREHPLWE
ncbi:Abi family protein [Oceanospirillum sp.]|uniref:Abi family protein n=1 Tax=Oceanospirillum sp. TaxID=2021254 RepID=UPI003A8EF9DC